jgi:peptidoglycan/LPS O-acetylase OafA/YrhL
MRPVPDANRAPGSARASLTARALAVTSAAMTGIAEGAYRPGVDGLRAIAVAAVVLFHLDRLPGGNLGVDAFFVVSGWLITWRLLGEHDRRGTIDLPGFWAARVRRLVPASLAVLVFVAIVWPVLGIEVATLRRDIGWAAAWMSNWGTISSGGDYWSRFGEPSPVTHFWSLAIEEQFYLVWPPAVVVLARRTGAVRSVVLVAGLAGAIASVAVMNLTFDPADPTATYMHTAARAHSLLFGAAAGAVTALLPNGRLRFGRASRSIAPFAAVAALAIMAVADDESTWLFRWGFPAFAVAMVVVAVAVADGAAARVLASSPMRWVGTRSYGIYLWHWPIILLLTPGRIGLDGSAWSIAAIDLAAVLVTLVVAELSFRVVESPIRRHQLGVRWAPIAVAAIVVLAVAVVPATTLRAPVSEIRLPDAPVAVRSPAAPAGPNRAGPTTPNRSDATPRDRSVPGIPAVARDGTPDRAVRVLVSGDSTGYHLANAFVAVAAGTPEEFVVGSAAFPGCGLSAADDGRRHEFTDTDGDRELIDLAPCRAHWDSVVERVTGESVDVVVVQIGPWDAVDVHLADGTVVAVDDPIGENLLTAAYRNFVDRVERAGARVVWVTPPDTHLWWGRIEDPVNEPTRWAAVRRIVDGLGVAQIDLPGWLSTTGLEGPEGRPDGVHLGPGLDERFVIEAVVPRLRELSAHAAAS